MTKKENTPLVPFLLQLLHHHYLFLHSEVSQSIFTCSRFSHMSILTFTLTPDPRDPQPFSLNLSLLSAMSTFMTSPPFMKLSLALVFLQLHGCPLLLHLFVHLPYPFTNSSSPPFTNSSSLPPHLLLSSNAKTSLAALPSIPLSITTSLLLSGWCFFLHLHL